MSFWKRVIWSDKKKFELFGAKRRVIVYRRPGERYKLKYLKSTIKHGGSALEIINGKMKQHVYRSILEDNLQFSTDLMEIGGRLVFKQDLDSKYTALAARDFFEENNVDVLNWSPQSPDPNIIEHAWEYLDTHVLMTARTNKISFMKALQETWDQLPQDYINTLVESVPWRLQAIINAKEAPTRY
jgi:hypothetical protein